MAILNSELKFYKPATVNDTSSNGGIMSTLAADYLTSGGSQITFANVLASERASGSTKYRKVFMKVANDSDLTLSNPQVWLDAPTGADDWVVFFAGTQTDTQGDIGSPRIYGAADLKTSITGGATSTIVVTVEDTTVTGMFADGDTIRITDMTDPTSGTGNEEFLTVTGTPSVSGDEVTITVTSNVAASYTAGSAWVQSIYSTSDVVCSVDNWVETLGGTYDETTYPVLCDNIGTIEQTWTITFTDATNFTVAGNTVGSLASGTTGGDYAPSNAEFTKPYFTLYSAGWGGTMVNGNTLVFQTHPATIPIWEKRVVPAAAASLSNNRVRLVIAGESA